VCVCVCGSNGWWAVDLLRERVRVWWQPRGIEWFECTHTQREIADLKLLSAVYTIDNEGLEKDGAVVGFASEFVNHACVSPDGLTFVYVTRRWGGGDGRVRW